MYELTEALQRQAIGIHNCPTVAVLFRFHSAGQLTQVLLVFRIPARPPYISCNCQWNVTPNWLLPLLEHGDSGESCWMFNLALF